SPPQIEMIGAPHSSTAAKHSSTVSFSVIVERYSRMRPQPVQVRLQACSGSSIMTSGNFWTRRSRWLAMYAVVATVSRRGNRIGHPLTGLSEAIRNRAVSHGAARRSHVAPERTDRKRLAIEVVVTQVEDQREPRASRGVLVPRSIPVLVIDQPG